MLLTFLRGIWLTLTLVLISPPSFAAQTDCADSSFPLYYAFADKSKGLHVEGLAPDTKSQEQISHELFDLVDQLYTQVVACPDRRLPRLFSQTVDFLFLTNKSQDLLKIYEAFIKNAYLTDSQKAEYSDNLFQMHWQTRNFSELERIKSSFPVSEHAISHYPLVLSSDTLDTHMLLKSRVTPETDIEVSSYDLDEESLQVVAVIDLSCGFSRTLLETLQEDPSLFDSVKNITFVFPQASFASPRDVARLSNDIGNMKFAIINNEKAWPTDIYFHEFPMFYFLHNNQVVHRISGWPSEEQAKVIADAYTKVQLDIGLTNTIR
ncbi:hypothetical protein IDSA_04835 [Pseudidiomarina salinarum]|uniref:Thioredoxin domain-containing protein n=1 Tax=Pseudidiomarina salinarum TaxID=435908 RepID=A0A094IWE1_9GAMM|nr:hypothetical protein [Pseudidiomarina salinarum]KFZ32005.1 hypothetical protein IDSA_04835 [Pseudidiomarina salinarum]RUO70218.1 hypothetical protein CWI79_01745 [Pseudidiomarina salinarum]